MIFDFYNKNGALNSGPIFDAFEQGLRLLGHSVESHSMTGDVAVIWSVLWNGRMRNNKAVWDHYRKQNKPVIVLEIGCLRRDHTWKIGINGINQGSYFVANGNSDDRISKFGIKLSPWRTQGREILICTQHDKSQQWEQNPSLTAWVESTILKIRKHSDRPIKIRPHPRCVFPYPNLDNKIFKSVEKDILNDFKTAWAVINYSSNPGIQSVIHGIPTFVDNKSLASPVANTDLSLIENPNRPDRTQWLNDLAWTEWTVEEMKKGIPQQRLINHFQLSTITGSCTV